MKVVFIFSLLLLFSNLSFASLKVISIDNKGNETVNIINQDDYKNLLDKTLMSVTETISNSFDQYNPLLNKWELSQIDVGIGMSGEVGIGPFSMGLGTRHRFIYKRKN